MTLVYVFSLITANSTSSTNSSWCSSHCKSKRANYIPQHREFGPDLLNKSDEERSHGNMNHCLSNQQEDIRRHK